MTRVKRGNVARLRRKKILKLAKGFRGAQSKQFRTANQRVMQALRNSYRDRKSASAISAACGLLASMQQRASTARVTASSSVT